MSEWREDELLGSVHIGVRVSRPAEDPTAKERQSPVAAGRSLLPSLGTPARIFSILFVLLSCVFAMRLCFRPAARPSTAGSNVGSQAPSALGSRGDPCNSGSHTIPLQDGRKLGLVGEPISDISSSNSIIYAATDGAEHGVFKSSNLGRDWQAVNNGLLDFDIRQVEVSPENPNLVYIVDGGLWRSEDGGATWLPGGYETNTCGNPRSVVLASDDGLTIVWLYCRDFTVSYDGGRNWNEFGTGVHGGKLVSAPSNRSTIYGLVLGSGDEPRPDTIRVVIGDEVRPLAKVGPGTGCLRSSYRSARSVFALRRNSKRSI